MYGTYDSPADAYRALGSVAFPLVVKADGLCAGKGVFLAPDFASAKDFVERAMAKNELGPGGKRILLEETLKGEELSFIILTDGKQYAPFVPTRDHKRVFDGNQGPNTGGMGAYSSDELLPDDLREAIRTIIVEPTLEGLAADGIHYQGFLYFGLMLTRSGPKVLEFQLPVRRPGGPGNFGHDWILTWPRSSTMLLPAALIRQKFIGNRGPAPAVVLASGGYPGKFESGKRVEG